MISHRPLMFVVLSYALGIMASQWVPSAITSACLLSIGLLAGLWLAQRKPFMATVLLLLVFVCLGIIQTQTRQTLSKNHIAQRFSKYNGYDVSLKGVVVSDIEEKVLIRGEKTIFTLDILAVESYGKWREYEGRILVHVFKDVPVVYGDLVLLGGRLYRPFNYSPDERFSYRDYLENREIYFLMSIKKDGVLEILAHDQASRFMASLFKLKEKLKNVLAEGLTKNETALMHAFLLGDRTDIPKHIKELFIQTGTAHILAISGLNVGIVAVLFLVFLKMLPIPRLGQLILTVLLLILYACLTGASPSVTRATIMSSIFFMSFIFEKQSDTLNALFLAAFLILLFNPLNLFDVGFQLSFCCVFAIIMMGLKLRAKTVSEKVKEKKMPVILEYLLISLAVWIAVAGLIAYYFHIVTPITILANFIVVPVSTALVALGFGMLLTSGFPALNYLFACSIKMLLNAMVGVIFLFAKCPFAYTYLKGISLWQVITYYILIGVIFTLPLPRFSFKQRLKDV